MQLYQFTCRIVPQKAIDDVHKIKRLAIKTHKILYLTMYLRALLLGSEIDFSGVFRA